MPKTTKIHQFWRRSSKFGELKERNGEKCGKTGKQLTVPLNFGFGFVSRLNYYHLVVGIVGSTRVQFSFALFLD
jgi:hypothetical protein